MWSDAVVPFYFETISINTSRYANVIMDHWNDDFFGPDFHCPVRRLTIGKLSLPREAVHEKEEVQEGEDDDKEVEEEGVQEEGDEDEEGEDEDEDEDKDKDKDEDKDEEHRKKWKEDAEERANLVTVNQLARLIELFGTNLKTLNMTFICSMGVSPELVKACKTIKELRSLAIFLNYADLDTGPFDMDSISRLLSSLPRLESFLCGFNCVEPLSLESPALQNLRHYSFILEWIGLEGITRIIQTAKDTLKIIELLSGRQPTEGVERVFEPIKDTLEGLFTSSSTDQIIEHVTEWDFPNLRVIRTHYPPEEVEEEIYWLRDPMMKNVRTIVTDLDCSEEYWIVALEEAGIDALKKSPNFKHIVFTKSEESDSQEIGPELVKAFKSHGVQCHLSHELTPDECMELDYMLNGPMK